MFVLQSQKEIMMPLVMASRNFPDAKTKEAFMIYHWNLKAQYEKVMAIPGFLAERAYMAMLC